MLTRVLGWTAEEVADQLDDLVTIVGAPLTMSQEWLREAARLAEAHGLSFYDASWAAAAAELEVTLVSADRRLTSADLAETATEVSRRLRLT